MKEPNPCCSVCHGVGRYALSLYKNITCPLCCSHDRYYVKDQTDLDIKCVFCGWIVRNEPWREFKVEEYDSGWFYDMIVKFTIHGVHGMEFGRKTVVAPGSILPQYACAMSRIIP